MSTPSDERHPPLVAKALPLENPNDYSVMLRWSLEEGLIQEATLYRLEHKGRSFVAHVIQNEGSISEPSLPGGSRQRYEIVAHSGEVLATTEIVVPKDLVVTGETQVPADYATISRVFFERNSVLVTSGMPIDWTINELHAAPGARVTSFIAERPARAGYPARSSGSGRIKILKLTNILQVEWRGETGSEGAVGATNRERGPNAPGARWVTLSSFEKREFGDRPVGTDRPCKPGRDGIRGGQGPRGLPGGRGENGGDTEDLMIEILDSDLGSTVALAIEAGHGGPGGQGGVGGPGGRGSRGSSGGGMECPDGRDGGEGPQGPQGPAGPQGLAGVILGRLCLTEGAKTHCAK